MRLRRLLLQLALNIIAMIGASQSFAYGLTPEESDYVIYPTVHAGEELRIQFLFKGWPASDDGLANFLIFSNGGTSKSFVKANVSLYVGDVLLGRDSTSGCLACSYFTAETGLFIFGRIVDSSGLASILGGFTSATLVYLPTFSDQSGFVSLAGWKPHAGFSNEPLSLVGLFPSPKIVSTTIASIIPEPTTYAMLLTGMVLILITKNRQPGRIKKINTTRPISRIPSIQDELLTQ
jgi:hypothetical protein